MSHQRWLSFLIHGSLWTRKHYRSGLEVSVKSCTSPNTQIIKNHFESLWSIYKEKLTKITYRTDYDTGTDNAIYRKWLRNWKWLRCISEMITPAPEVSCFYSHVYLPTLYKVHERVTEVTKQIFLFIILRFYEVFHGYLLVSTFNIHPSIYPSICLYHSIHLYRSVDLLRF